MDPINHHVWQGKKVVVTGAGGFIGSQLVEALLAEGAQVRAFVRYNSRGDPGLLRMCPPELSEQLEIIPGDLRDADAVHAALRDCEVVFHLGALISIPYSYRHPAEVAEVNFMGTLNVLMACRDLKIPRLVHTSTSEVYGTARRAPIDEEHPLQGQSPYSASKIGADKLAESFHCAYDLPVVTIRPFNTFGPRQSARAVIPTNPQTRGIRPAEIKRLFPNCRYQFRKITLAPPIARKLASVSWGLCYLLESLKIFNTHYLAVIRPLPRLTDN